MQAIEKRFETIHCLCLFVGQVVSPHHSDHMGHKFHRVSDKFTYIAILGEVNISFKTMPN